MKQSGFTLIEMMVVLAIAVILTTSAIPSFQNFIQNNRMSTTAHQFITSVNLARSEAVKRGQRVTMCVSNDGKECDNAGTKGWAQGWIIFVDNGATVGDRDIVGTAEELIRVQNAISGVKSIDGPALVEDVISYGDSGFIQPIGGGNFSKSTLVICDDRDFGAHVKALVINTTGSIRSTPSSDPSVTGCSV